MPGTGGWACTSCIGGCERCSGGSEQPLEVAMTSNQPASAFLAISE
jgi:hypothetical protein